MPIPGPETRVVELRVPGLSGTGGEALLDVVSTVEVAGDGVGTLIRPSDRLRRPAPGPVLQALGRSVPRTLEGYLWGRMTSGGAAKAAWALLFPFSLSNVAFWMLPPVPEGSRSAAALGGLCRSLLRVAGLLLTMLLVGQLAVLSLDLFATQCLSPGSACLPSVPEGLRGQVARTVAGLVPAAVVIFVLYRISCTRWTVTCEDPPARRGPLPGDAVRDGLDSPTLRSLHTAAALATVVLLALGGPLRVPHAVGELVVWCCALAVVLVALVLAGTGSSLPRWARGGLLTFAVLVFAAVAAFRPALPAGSDATVQALGAALLLVSVLFAVLLVPAALVARRTWREQPKRLRPWLGGWAAAPVLALAVLLGGGFGAGLAIGVRRLTGASWLRLPDSYTPVTVLWGGGLALAAVLGVLGFAVAVPLRRRRRGVPEAVKLLQEPADQPRAAAAWARSAWERRHLHHLAFGVVFGMSAGAAALLVVRFVLRVRPGWFEPLSALGVFALGALAVGLLRVVYTAARKPGRNRHLGALADLVCFWPRAAHPVVPPCYALKVVPELAARAKEHLAEPNTRVVLAGHQIGSLLAVLAAARLVHALPEGERTRVGLLTAGSPLQWGYQRAFPAVLSRDSLARLFGELEGRWRGLARGTDILGGGVTTWRQEVVDGELRGVGYLPEGGVGDLAPALSGPTGALVLGGDHWLPDPIANPAGTRRYAAGVLGHADYEVDPEWDRAVAMAAGLEFPGRPASRPFGEQVPLFPDLPRFNLGVAR
ncbi:membrane protein [Amycolatopsis dongchuanensis]|uniref:Membrane protein n=1 Tax=Amycolatopsis dongchuanensis TaxID=1070866 RepID=A0ABP9PXA0_9PSEU